MFTGPVGPVEVFFTGPKLFLGIFTGQQFTIRQKKCYVCGHPTDPVLTPTVEFFKLFWY